MDYTYPDKPLNKGSLILREPFASSARLPPPQKDAFNIGDLADGIIDKRVYYEDSLERLAIMMNVLKESDRVLYLPVGNVFSNGIEEHFSDYDKDVIKV